MIHNHSARKLYHLTKFDYGSSINWNPRDFGDNRADSEPKISRICFSLLPAGCFLSLGYIATQYPEWHLYSTVDSYYQPSANEVVDSEITSEVWRMDTTYLQKVHSFSIDEKTKMQEYLYFVSGNPSAIKYQIKCKPKIACLIKEIIDAKT
jgi:hypothetical protein